MLDKSIAGMKYLFKNLCTSLVAICAGYAAVAQTTLDECIGLSVGNYPQINEMSLIEKTKGLDLKNAAFAWLPQLNVSGKATWQSQVVELPFEMPGVEFNIPHDQYSLVAELSQQIWDGGASHSQRKLVEAGAGVSAGTNVSPSKVEVAYLYNPYLDYKLFMLPALIVIAITMMCGFLPALNIVGEKEKGTIEQINVTPVRKSSFIICKMIPYVAVAYFLLFSCLLLTRIVFGYSCQGSLLAIALFTFAHIVVMASFGLLISNYSENTQQAMFVIWFFSMVFMLMSGIFTPIASMPHWAEIITYANPLRYYADAMRSIYLKGGTLLDNWFDFVCLAGIGTITTIWAIKSYKKTV